MIVNNHRLNITFAILLSVATVSFCAAAGCSSTNGSAMKVVAPVCTTSQQVYGVPLAAVTLANVEIGRDHRQLSYRFQAAQSALLDNVRVYVKVGPGYSLGDGGMIRVDLESDDGTSQHTPSGKSLASATITQLQSGPFNRVLTFGSPVALTAGTLYHLVFSNPSSAPTQNFSSLNDIMFSGNPVASQLSDVAVLTTADGSAGWSQFGNHLPIFALSYSNGTTQGQGYIDAIADGPATGHVTGQNRAREVIAVHGAAQSAAQVSVFARAAGTAASLHIRLENAGQQAMAEGDVALQNTDFDWVTFTFPAPQTLASGQTYNLVLSADQGQVDIIPVQAGSASGFNVPTLFTDGTYQLANGNAFATAGLNLQMQFFFCAANQAAAAASLKERTGEIVQSPFSS